MRLRPREVTSNLVDGVSRSTSAGVTLAKLPPPEPSAAPRFINTDFIVPGHPEPVMLRYFDVVQQQRRLPVVFPFLRRNADELCFDGKPVSDEDLLAVVESNVVKQTPWKVFDMSGTGASLALPAILDQLASSHCLLSLDLSACRVGPVVEGLAAFLGCSICSTLRLNSVNCLAREWKVLLAGVRRSSVKFLELADCAIGAGDDGVPGYVAECMPTLVTLDVSYGHFSASGYRALARGGVEGGGIVSTTTLQRLDLCGCAGGFSRVQTKLVAEGPLAEGHGQVLVQYSGKPVAEFLEALSDNSSLQFLSLQSANLGYEEDQVMEDALQNHGSLEELDLSYNPHGGQGLRALFRLLCRPSCRVNICHVRQFRVVADDEQHLAPAKIYQFSSPTGSYRLWFSHPQHRALLRCLLRRADATAIGIERCFTSITAKDSEQPAKPVRQVPVVRSTRDGVDVWQVPLTGWVEFHFKLFEEWEATDGDGVISEWFHRRRLPCGLAAFTILLSMFRELETQEQIRAFCQALARDLQLRHAQVRLLVHETLRKRRCLPDKRLLTEIAYTLMPAMRTVDKLAVQDLVPRSVFNIVAALTTSLVFFNPKNPTGRYRLHLGNPADRAACERVFVLASWEKARSFACGIPDTSRFGDREVVRNMTFTDQSNRPRAVRFMPDWLPPYDCPVVFDFVAPFRMPVDRPAVPDVLLSRLVDMLQRSECTLFSKTLALRSVSSSLVVTAEQVGRLMLLDRATDGALVGRKVKLRKANLVQHNMQVQWEDVTWGAEVFVCLFNRCTDQPTLVSSAVLYNSRFLSEFDVRACVDRLGRLNTFSALEACSVRANLGHARHSMNLGIWEDWVLAKLFVTLGAIEEGENIVKARLTGVSHVYGDFSFIIPSNWFPDPPGAGRGCQPPFDWTPDHEYRPPPIISFEYVSVPSAINRKERIKLGVKLLAWQNGEAADDGT